MRSEWNGSASRDGDTPSRPEGPGALRTGDTMAGLRQTANEKSERTKLRVKEGQEPEITTVALVLPRFQGGERSQSRSTRVAVWRSHGFLRYEAIPVAGARERPNDSGG